MSLGSIKEKNRSPEQSVTSFEVIIECINLIWTHKLKSTQKLTLKFDSINEYGITIRERIMIEVVFGSAYYIDCIRSAHRHPNVRTNGELIETIEVILEKDHLQIGMMNVTHINSKDKKRSADISMRDIPNKEPDVDSILQKIEKQFLAILIKESVGKDIFDPLPKIVQQLVIKSYGKDKGDKLWIKMT